MQTKNFSPFFKNKAAVVVTAAVTLVTGTCSNLVAAQAVQVVVPASNQQETEKEPLLKAQSDVPRLAEVTVQSSALSLGSNDIAIPVSVLEGDFLILKRAATLGETLREEPGIHASHFGAGASRPIIRGMDGPRVKILSDGSEIYDASTMSPDHAVALEPMLAQQIEVLRGPSALAYGGGAVGGVVNVLDHKIPTALPSKLVDAAVELRANSAAKEVATAFELTAGSGNVALHLEGLTRDANAYRVGKNWEHGSRVEGSYNNTDTGSVGVSLLGDRGYVGMAYTEQRSRYGLPGHDESYADCHVHGSHLHCEAHGDGEDDGHGHGDGHDHGIPFVKLKSERWDFRGEYREPFAGFAKASFRAGVTDYQHQEIEGDVVATTFKNKAHDVRLDLEHHPLAGFRGVVGVQKSKRDFSAIGAESYVAPTVTDKSALFLLEEYKWSDWRFEAGLRHEWQTITLETPATRKKHQATSASLGAVWKFVPGYSLGLTWANTQRMPTAEELFADGLHMATTTYEQGNPHLKKESAQNIDVSLRKLTGPTTFSAGIFYNQVSDYIYGRTIDSFEALQLLQYTQADVVFAGFEGHVRQQLNRHWGVSLFGDYVRAKLKHSESGASYLPRIPAARLGLRADAQYGAWSGQVEGYQVAKQNRITQFESITPSYRMLNLELAYNGRVQKQDYMVYAKLNNAADTLAYAHTSFIKDTAPLMGRNLTIGVRLPF